MSTAVRRSVLLILLASALALIASCREDEQGRLLFEQKGVYQGEADQPLSQEQLDALRQRASNQQI